jgi:hypothetical protein
LTVQYCPGKKDQLECAVADFLSKQAVAFIGPRCIARGPLAEVALVANTADLGEESLHVFDEATGNVIDLDLRGDAVEILQRLRERSKQTTARPQGSDRAASAGRRGRGRPKLGVVSREVTLLPRHWDWLAAQPGGASQALRRLVDEARRRDGGETEKRAAQEAAYRFMANMAGNLPGFEEATRALFANDRAGFARHVARWPEDVRAFAQARAFGASEGD